MRTSCWLEQLVCSALVNQRDSTIRLTRGGQILMVAALLIGSHSIMAADLINHTDFESDSGTPPPWKFYTHGKGDLREAVHVSDLARRGTGSEKFVMDRTPGGVFWRAMLRMGKGVGFSAATDERWMGFSTYIASSGADAWLPDTEDEIIMQLWNNGNTPPLLGLWFTRHDTMVVNYRSCAFSPKSDKDTKKGRGDVGTISSTHGHWLDWVFHVKLSPASPEGILEVWTRLDTEADYKKVVDKHNIEIGYPDGAPDIDIGIYKWAWKDRNAGAVNRRVIWFDEFRLGNASSSFAQVALPSGNNATAAPTKLTATAVSSSQINLSWRDNANNETGFKIERKTGAGGTWAQIATTGTNATSYSSTGLSGNTTYLYRVRSTNEAGDSAYSNEANATTGG